MLPIHQTDQRKAPSHRTGGLKSQKKPEEKKLADQSQIGQVPQPLSRPARSAPLVVPSPLISPPAVPQADNSVAKSAPLRNPSLLKSPGHAGGKTPLGVPKISNAVLYRSFGSAPVCTVYAPLRPVYFTNPGVGNVAERQLNGAPAESRLLIPS